MILEYIMVLVARSGQGDDHNIIVAPSLAGIE
jgi:hypothetical protein